MEKTALIYCEGNFDGSDGKTANGLIRHSKKFKITSIIDSTKAGLDSGEVLDGVKNNIPIYQDLHEAIDRLKVCPKYFIYGIAPKETILSIKDRRVLLQAISLEMDIVCGLHEFISDDREFVKEAKKHGVKLFDMRKPLNNRYLHLFSGNINTVKTPKIAIFGTDCAIGKRTTALLLTQALNKKGIRACFIGTGQTSIIQGEKYGIALDAIPSEFMTGEFENAIMDAYTHENPDVFILEGQSALSHEAFVSSCAIIRGGQPDAFILQHPPKRKKRIDFSYLKMPTIDSEINLIESFSHSKVIALTINHEKMKHDDIPKTIIAYEDYYKIPTDDTLIYGCEKLITAILENFPALKNKVTH
jgi:uncharacterized NAD-dependent epimerase/dehydratase family protein